MNPLVNLSAKDVAVQLGGRPVLRGVSCRLQRGWTAIVGPNGAGKSTLLRTFAGLLTPQQGQVDVDEQPVLKLAAHERARRIAWLAQTSAVSGELTARETVQLGRLAHLGLFAAPTAADEAAVSAAMHATECEAWGHRRLNALSGGERQRVLLARALATGAPVLLLDEPTTHLDPPHQVALALLMRRLAATHTLVSVLHDLTLALRADRVLVLREGALQADGVPGDAKLHASLEASFSHAIHIETTRSGRPVALPRLDD